MLGQLPIDVLYEILRSLSVQDIVRLQRVSKRFYEITQERIVWANAYYSTILPCPSGPHAGQDATFLKRQLIRSAKLEKNWPRRRVVSAPRLNTADSTALRDAHARREDAATRVYSPTSIRRFTLPIPRPLTLTAITGRWIVVVTGTGIWCVDLEAEEAQLASTEEDYVVRPVELHKCVDTTLEFWFVVSAMDREGRVIGYVVAEERAHTGNEEGPKWISLFKLNLPFKSGYNTSARCTGRVPIVEGTLFNAVLAHELLVIHVVAIGHAHRFWLVHTSTDRLYQMITAERAAEEQASWVSLHLCSTHVIMVQRRHHEPTRGWQCHIEAYPHPTLPSSNDPDPSTLDNNNSIPEIHLQLSHRGLCPASMLFSGPVVWERKMPRTTDGQTHRKNQGIRVVLIAHRAAPLPCLAATELVLPSSPISSPHSSAHTNPRLEPATITCILHDVLLPPDSDSRRGLFYTASRGNDSRGFIESSTNRGRRDQEKCDTFGFTLSLEVQPDLTPKPEQVGAGDLGNDQNTGTEKMKVSLWAEKLKLPVATGPCFVVGFDGNVGRIFRRHPSQGKEIMEIIDFA